MMDSSEIMATVVDDAGIEKPLEPAESKNVATAFKTLVASRMKPGTESSTFGSFFEAIDRMAPQLRFYMDPVDFRLHLVARGDGQLTLMLLERGTSWFQGFNHPSLVESAINALGTVVAST